MKIVETVLSTFILLNILYLLFYYVYNYLEFEFKRYELVRIKAYLLEVSDRYIDVYGYTLSSERSFRYLNKEVSITLDPVGDYCIYRVMKINGMPRQVFFCID